MSRRDSSGGLWGLVQAIGGNLAEIARGRLELFALELQEEKHRLIQMIAWTMAALFSGMMAFILINVTLVYLFWESARLTVLLSLTLFYTLMVCGISIRLVLYIKRQALPFAETIREFRKDKECFRRKC
jgi:uncharacterized membrane protein YqjE